MALTVGCATDQIYHKLTVTNGEGSGEYAAGSQVIVQADSAAPGFAFAYWLGDTVYLDNSRAPKTYISMPLDEVFIQAQFLPLPTYLLTVNGGSGSGRFLPGTYVLVNADQAPDHHVFDSWEGDIQFLGDDDEPETYLEMPAQAVTVTARYVYSDVISYSKDVQPLLNVHCISCHNFNQDFPLHNYNSVYALRNKIVSQTSYDMMPPSYSLTAAEKEILRKWVDQGAKNN